MQQYKLKNPFKVIFPAILMNSWKFTWTKKKSTRATRDARDKFNVCGKYIFRGKIDNSNVEKVETFKFA